MSTQLITRATQNSGDNMQDALRDVSNDANFSRGRFPDYKPGPNGVTVDEEHDHDSVPLKQIVATEAAEMVAQHKRLSVRDLRNKFEQGLSQANRFSDETKRKEAASLDRQVLLKKLRDVLESLRGRVAGRNREDVDEAISLVEALAVQLTQREGDLLYEKAEVKKLAAFLKQATEDAKRVVEEERAHALAENAKAKAAVARVEQALREHEQAKGSREQEELEELRKEVVEARRIKMLHQPSRVLDMEHELQALRTLVSEKTQFCNQLKKEIAMMKKLEEDISSLYELEGSEVLGSLLRIIPQVDTAPDISNSLIQWYRIMAEGNNKELISGATKNIYAPEPFDVGRILQVEIVLNEEKVMVQTAGPINPAAGLDRYVEALYKRADIEFNVVVAQMNGKDYPSNSVHVFHVGKLRIKLRKGRSTKAKESYSATMQLCGTRGGGNAATQAVFWQPRKGLSFTLAFETDRDRNAAIMLARKFASDCNIILAGPHDQVQGTSS